MNNSMFSHISQVLSNIRLQKPLVHHITNYVTVNDCANIVLAIGGAPVMADDSEEVKEIVSISSALVLNIGTLNQRTIDSMIIAGTQAKELKIPVIFDPVGAGASKLRTKTAERIIETLKPTVIRGNISEIKTLIGLSAKTRGVDAAEEDLSQGNTLQDVTKAVEQYSQRTGSVVAITGATDIISDGTRNCLIQNGHSMMSHVTGTGCMCTSLVGACCGATNDYFIGTVAGITMMGIAGEIAFNRIKTAVDGNSSYCNYIIDAVYNLTDKTVEQQAKVTVA